MTTRITPGPIISDTVRPEDTIPAMAAELERVGDVNGIQTSRVLDGAEAWVETGMHHDDDPCEIVCELMDCLSSYAPPYMYFGVHEGDGACLGWWVDHDEVYRGVKAVDAEPLVFDPEGLPRTFVGLSLEVNDHGNMTLWSHNGNDERSEVWALV